MSTYMNEESRLSTDMNESLDDRDDDFDFDEMGDQPLSRPRVDFTPTRDPLVAALFGPVGYSRDENTDGHECSLIS